MRVLATLFLAFTLLAIGLFLDVRSQLDAPLSLQGELIIEVSPGAGLHALLPQLERQELLPSRRAAWYLRLMARLDPELAQPKAGEYVLRPGVSLLAAFKLFASGKTLLHPLRIVEGMRYTDVLAQLKQAPALKQTLETLTPESLMQDLQRDAQHPEGRFFPDTYHIARGTTDVAFLKRAAAAMDKVLEQEWTTRAPDLPYANAEEALVMASIIEKETGLASERAEIAGVFVNRLRTGMRLQTDPTVIYGLGENFDGNLRREDLTTDTPYNTYTRFGLPPTPICLPGRAAIHAALHPAATQALYFVARGDGSHEFSETLEQHSGAVKQYQLRLQEQKN